jgi:hypothetical protein
VNVAPSPMTAASRLRAALVVLALLLAGCNDNGNGDAAPSPPVDETTTTTEPDGEWATCENPDEGYEVGYPADWETNPGDVMSPCSVFHPEPFEVPEATELPTDLAVAISVDPVSYDDVISPDPTETLESEEAGSVDGRDAVRFEAVATGTGLFPEGMQNTRWVVRVDGERTLIARTTDVGDPPYATKQQVLDDMMERLSFVASPDEGPDPVGEPQLGEVATPDFPFLAGETAFLVDVRAAAHDGFDRVVLEFDGTEQPAWRVTYADPPILEDASGRPVEVEGGAFLELRLTPATGVDLTGPEFEETYDGPTELRVDGNVVTEVVRIGDFEQNLAWVIGVDERRPFAVAFFADPLRLVVDIFDRPA